MDKSSADKFCYDNRVLTTREDVEITAKYCGPHLIED